MRSTMLAAALALAPFDLTSAGQAAAQAAPQAGQAADQLRAVAPENLLVIETSKGRILVEMDPRAAPRHVERVRTLADRGFYDGLKFHRVLPGFMAQTGDPQGTGEGGSDLPDLAGEFSFRRGRADGFLRMSEVDGLQTGVMGSLPVRTQPDAQMMVTADMRADATVLFCPGVAGMARNDNPNSANSQFFLMTGPSEELNGRYTAFGRIVAGLDVVRALKAGSSADNGAVVDPDVMTRVRTAAALPEGQRPSVRVMTVASPTFAELVEVNRAPNGRVNVCITQPAVEVTG